MFGLIENSFELFVIEFIMAVFDVFKLSSDGLLFLLNFFEKTEEELGMCNDVIGSNSHDMGIIVVFSHTLVAHEFLLLFAVELNLTVTFLAYELWLSLGFGLSGGEKVLKVLHLPLLLVNLIFLIECFGDKVLQILHGLEVFHVESLGVIACWALEVGKDILLGYSSGDVSHAG